MRSGPRYEIRQVRYSIGLRPESMREEDGCLTEMAFTRPSLGERAAQRVAREHERAAVCVRLRQSRVERPARADLALAGAGHVHDDDLPGALADDVVRATDGSEPAQRLV